MAGFVRLIGVTKRFGDVTAVNNLNYEIGKGECFSMLGPSGCGKTTTLRTVKPERMVLRRAVLPAILIHL